MSGLYSTRHNATIQEALSVQLRQLRLKDSLPLWKVAAAAEMDSTLLSKIENGKRLPTESQTEALAKFFRIPSERLHGARIAAMIWREHSGHPAFAKATALIQDAAGEYRVKRMPGTASKSAASVNKQKKKK